METKSTHTVTPWKQNGRKVTGGEYQAETIGVGIAGKTGKLRTVTSMTTSHELAFTVRHEADAIFIKTAVNSHDELVNALAQGEDIISGLEAEADNAGLDLEEVRHWWAHIATQALRNAQEESK